jgi:Kef-type K+ transport system membrane component KefB
MEQVWFTAASWLGVALLASLISIRIGISVALVEIFLGTLAGNFLGFHSVPWIDVLAAFGSMMLTFLAGAEIDPVSFRKHLKPSLVIGFSFISVPGSHGLYVTLLAGTAIARLPVSYVPTSEVGSMPSW